MIQRSGDLITDQSIHTFFFLLVHDSATQPKFQWDHHSCPQQDPSQFQTGSWPWLLHWQPLLPFLLRDLDTSISDRVILHVSCLQSHSNQCHPPHCRSPASSIICPSSFWSFHLPVLRDLNASSARTSSNNYRWAGQTSCFYIRLLGVTSKLFFPCSPPLSGFPS